MSIYRFTEVTDRTRESKTYWDKRCQDRWGTPFHGHFLDDPANIKEMDDVNYLEITRLLAKIRQFRFEDNSPIKVLECACGVGRYAGFVSNLADEYVGIDFADKNIEEAKRVWKDKNITFYMSDMQSFKTDVKFDLIFMVAAWSSIEANSQEIINHLKTLLAPGGVIAVFEQNEYFVKWRN